jgi:hypothetical protein
MDAEALRTIKVQNWKYSIAQVKRAASEFLKLLSTKYPLGLEDVVNATFFVMPGYEHVTKNQPIAVFNGSQGEWELSTSTQFVEPN